MDENFEKSSRSDFGNILGNVGCTTMIPLSDRDMLGDWLLYKVCVFKYRNSFAVHILSYLK